MNSDNIYMVFDCYVVNSVITITRYTSLNVFQELNAEMFA